MLRFFGCTADAAATASAVGGNETDFYGAMAPVAMGSIGVRVRLWRPARQRWLSSDQP